MILSSRFLSPYFYFRASILGTGFRSTSLAYMLILVCSNPIEQRLNFYSASYNGSLLISAAFEIVNLSVKLMITCIWIYLIVSVFHQFKVESWFSLLWHQVLEFSEAYQIAVQCYKDQRNKVSRLKKKIARTEGFREYKKIIDVAKFTEDKIRRLKARSRRLVTRIEQIEPSGWKEFLQVIMNRLSRTCPHTPALRCSLMFNNKQGCDAESFF